MVRLDTRSIQLEQPHGAGVRFSRPRTHKAALHCSRPESDERRACVRARLVDIPCFGDAAAIPSDLNDQQMRLWTPVSGDVILFCARCAEVTREIREMESEEVGMSSRWSCTRLNPVMFGTSQFWGSWRSGDAKPIALGCVEDQTFA
jgi:hypothetical protein